MRRVLAILLLLAPAAYAHEAGEAFDPLSLSWTAALTADGRLSEIAGPAGALFLPAADPTAAPLPLAFAAEAPATFRLDAPLVVALELQAERPVLAQDREGRSVEVTLRAGDQVLARGTGGVAAALLAPGDQARVTVEAAPTDAVAPRGAALGLEVRPLMPALAAESLKVLVGEGGSTAALALRLPGTEALELQDEPRRELLLAKEAYAPPAGATTLTFHVGHANVSSPRVEGRGAAPFAVVLLGSEPATDAHAHEALTPAARRNASHEFLVNGEVVRVHPGVGVVVPLDATPVVSCARNCPAAFRFAYDAAAPVGSTPATTTPDASVLIPPPRSTEGVPVSGDAPLEGEKATPLASHLVAIAVIVAVMLRRASL